MIVEYLRTPNESLHLKFKNIVPQLSEKTRIDSRNKIHRCEAKL